MPGRCRALRVLGLYAAVLIGFAGIYLFVIRPWHRSWGHPIRAGWIFRGTVQESLDTPFRCFLGGLVSPLLSDARPAASRRRPRSQYRSKRRSGLGFFAQGHDAKIGSPAGDVKMEITTWRSILNR